ncbi:hypothetical protein OAM69_02340 [bacterium]|nr:hypothetical protein [bacterium]
MIDRRILFRYSFYAAGLVLTASCGGGGGNTDSAGDTSDDIFDTPTIQPADTGTQSALPDFEVTDFVIAPTNQNRITAQVTVINNGTGPGSVPGGYIKSSQDADLSTNYRATDVSFRAQDGGGSALEPGESGVFDVRGIFGFLDIPTSLNGVRYLQAWVNPDTSIRFDNFGRSVETSYDADESDYQNNLSSIVVQQLGDIRSNPCSPDQFEPDNTVSQATPLEFDISYMYNGCEDLLDIASIALEAGESYLIDIGTTAGADDSNKLRLTIVDPSNDYVARDIGDDERIVTAEQSGVYLLVLKEDEPRLSPGPVTLRVTRI